MAAPDEPVIPQATPADRVGAGCLLAFGVAGLAFALLLPLGYTLTESDNVTFLVAAMATFAVIGIAALALGRSALRRD